MCTYHNNIVIFVMKQYILGLSETNSKIPDRVELGRTATMGIDIKTQNII